MLRLKMSLATQILIAMIAGSIVGVAFGGFGHELKFIGDIWLNMLKAVMIPLVLFSVINAIASMDNPGMLGRIATKVLAFYLITVMFAAFIGVAVTLAMKPGIGFHFSKATKVFDMPHVSTAQEFVTSLFTPNIFVSFTKGDMMQILMISILIGIAMISLKKQFKQPLIAWFGSMTELTMALVNIIMRLAPIGVFCIMAAALSASGLGMFVTMGKLALTFYIACFIQLALVYLILLWATTGISPLEFMRKSIRVWMTAISTCSSAAVMPVAMQTCDEEFGVSEKISRFTIPTGVQFNQDGGAILSAAVILFSAQAIGTEFGLMELIRVVLICTIVSAGGGAIPGGGIVRLMVSSAALGMPTEIVAIMAGFYRIFDMGTTSMCCIGDLSITVMIDRWERRRGLNAAKKVEGLEEV